MLLLTSALFLSSPAVFAQDAATKGYNIMKQVDALPVFEKTLNETEMKIFDAQGKVLFTKKARAATFVKDFRNPDKKLSMSISYFYAPADDKGNAALMLEKDGEDDDQWLYLKGLRKPKRVIGSDKSSSFMGSDFSNGDMAARDIDDYQFQWLASEKVAFKGKGIPTEKIQMSFKSDQQKEDYGYSKSVIWVHPKTGLVFKGELYNLDGQLSKKMSLISFKVLKNKDSKKVFLPTGMQMENVIRGTKTQMQITRTKVENQAAKVKPGIFTLPYMTRRWW